MKTLVIVAEVENEVAEALEKEGGASLVDWADGALHAKLDAKSEDAYVTDAFIAEDWSEIVDFAWDRAEELGEESGRMAEAKGRELLEMFAAGGLFGARTEADTSVE